MFNTSPVLLGQYRPFDSFLHHLDARAKMLPITIVLVLGLLTTSYTFYLVILGSLIFGLLMSGVTLHRLIGNYKPVIMLVVITALYHLIFSGKDTEVLYSILGYDLTIGALDMAAFFSLRLVLFISIAFLITFTSSPSELADSFTKLLTPLSKFKVPVQDLGLILFMAIRFIPVLYDEFKTIRNAQVIRGVKFSGSFINKVKKTACIIIPVFVAALQRADELAMAIEARGYDGDSPRTMYTGLKIGFKEWVFMVLTAIGIFYLYWVTK